MIILLIILWIAIGIFSVLSVLLDISFKRQLTIGDIVYSIIVGSVVGVAGGLVYCLLKIPKLKFWNKVVYKSKNYLP